MTATREQDSDKKTRVLQLEGWVVRTSSIAFTFGGDSGIYFDIIATPCKLYVLYTYMLGRRGGVKRCGLGLTYIFTF